MTTLPLAGVRFVGRLDCTIEHGSTLKSDETGNEINTDIMVEQNSGYRVLRGDRGFIMQGVEMGNASIVTHTLSRRIKTILPC